MFKLDNTISVVIVQQPLLEFRVLADNALNVNLHVNANRSNAVNAQRERDIDTVTAQRTPGGLCTSAIDLLLRLHCN